MSFQVFDEYNRLVGIADTLTNGLKIAQREFNQAVLHQLGLDNDRQLGITAEARYRTKPSFTVKTENGDVVAQYPNYDA